MIEKRRHSLHAAQNPSALPAQATPMGNALAQIVDYLLVEDPALPDLGFLTSAQLRFLWWVYDGGEITFKEAGKRLCKSRSVAVRRANVLARLGFIERYADPLNGVAYLRLTDTCRSLLAKAEEFHRRRLQALWNALPDEKTAAVASGLELLIKTVETAHIPAHCKSIRHNTDS